MAKAYSRITDVPHYNDLLEFINLRAQASEALPATKRGPTSNTAPPRRTFKPIASHVAISVSEASDCLVCKTDKHPLYMCQQFKALSHDQKISIVKKNGICMNCLKHGHFIKQCKSVHHCKVCQKPHHTLLHLDNTPTPASGPIVPSKPDSSPQVVASNVASSLSPSALLMTCIVQVRAPDGSTVHARALLDSASSASFVSE